MKAVVYTRYGGPEVLHLVERDTPAPAPGQVLVRVEAVSLNPLEWHHVRGKPFLVRTSAGLFRPKPHYQLQGVDVAGVVESVGTEVTRFRPGDAVFGAAKFGGLAEFVAIKEDSLQPLPSTMAKTEAACLPVAGGTALQSLREHGKVKPGDHVLINGSSGGVGTYAVQIAKAFGARVTAVCSTRNVDLVRSLGADEVLDYTAVDVAASGRYDVVIDNAGTLSLKAFTGLLKPQGRGVVVGFTSLGRMIHIAAFGKGRGVAPMMANATPEVLATLAGLAEAGKIRTVLDSVWSLEQVAPALAYLEGSHARGKVVVTIPHG